MNKYLYMKNVLLMSDHEIGLVKGLSKNKKKIVVLNFLLRQGTILKHSEAKYLLRQK